MPEHLRFSVHNGERVHLGITGSVAAYKAVELLRMLQELELQVSVTLTEAAARFVTPLTFQALDASPVYHGMWDGAESAFGHLEPAQEARCLLVAPATANTLAKMAHGIADDLLSTQALAFTGPVVVAPAMNPRLWDAPATQENLATLRGRGVRVLEPCSGRMACGEKGKGRLTDLRDIVAHCLKALTVQDMAGTQVLVSLGPTREFFDPARYWSNPSTGIMGGALAMAAWMRGAQVSVVHGPVDIWLPPAVSYTAVNTAREMFTACTDLWPAQDVGIMTAAVSDFSPVPHGPEKFKKRSLNSGEFTVPFAVNPDILRTLGHTKTTGQKLIGFCAETRDLAGYAAFKLKEKRCDLMVANSIASPGSGFGSPTNAVTVLDAHNRLEEWPVLPKAEVAWRLLEWLVHILR
ncbi:bifunctional phosphopantothenoylcysteine decarboxylase/phosphopantothenate--cysteine ligase CoaBC [Fundidesulfovibrio magnetotacticus]|uniref:bifunctional phosphopantothenoylcysteine decarboxylase/phosphopantothenate--cysteine ligase CoaBC n=1 Tax=Fundidesulfovibrio magnetotacticus TaxID=2730080 RepID=UPI00353088AC